VNLAAIKHAAAGKDEKDFWGRGLRHAESLLFRTRSYAATSFGFQISAAEGMQSHWSEIASKIARGPRNSSGMAQFILSRRGCRCSVTGTAPNYQ
jgi:hypothetical protein